MLSRDPYSEFVKWVGHHNVRSYSQIAVACGILAKSYGISDSAAVNVIFDRLYRVGIIEFAGGNNYKLGPAIIIINKAKRICTALNCRSDLRLLLLQRFQGVESICGIIKFPFQNGCTLVFGELNIPFVFSENCSLLEKVPSLMVVIKGFERLQLTREYYLFLDLVSSSWIRKRQMDGVGICKIDEASNVYFIITDDGEMYKIPSLGYNPEAFQVALNYQRGLMRTENSIKYHSNDRRLQVYYAKLPVIIERLLRLLSIHNIDLNYMDNVGCEFEEVSTQTYNRIKRILTV